MPDKPAPLTVTQLNQHIRRTLEERFASVWVEGELSNVRVVQSSGHAYFTLKDAESQISVAVFAGVLRTVPFRLADGVKVRVRGKVSVFSPRGTYQIIATAVERVGAGDLMAQFEELKRKLAAEGLFSEDCKRPLPLLPRIVGIVTSPTGAAIRDMLQITRRRFPNMHIVLAPTRVQGEGAAAEIVSAIGMLNALPEERRPEILIVGRGGGSIEDLWSFNEEIVARAIRASAIPVISAVGHEIDFTISDFAADLRAPTPSAAAELVVGRKDEFLERLAGYSDFFGRELRHAVSQRRSRLLGIRNHHAFSQPRTLVAQHRQGIDLLSTHMQAALVGACQRAGRGLALLQPRYRAALTARMVREQQRVGEAGTAMRHCFQTWRGNAAQSVEALRRQLVALSPLAVLERGYSVTRGPDGALLRSVTALELGARVTTRLADGEFTASVLDTAGGADTAATAAAAPAPKRPRKPRVKEDGAQMTLF